MKNKTAFILLACAALLALACICSPAYWFSDEQEESDYYYEETEESEGLYGEPSAAEETSQPTETFAACSLQLAELLREAEEEDEYDESDFEMDEELALVTYQVSGGKIHSPVFEKVDADFVEYQQDEASHAAIWDFFTSIIPASQLWLVNEFVIFTDGYANTMGAVEQSDDPRYWILSMDIADAENFPVASTTLVHEFGHLLTLNERQVKINMELFENPDDLEIYEEAEAACDTYFLYEGCSQEDSYINLFFQEFWPGLYEEWLEIDSLEDEEEYDEAIYEFYEAYPDQFVNDYAATNPEEDIAESWTYFIFTPKPAGDSIAEEKILFFYDFPELVELRAQILESLCAYVEE